MLYTFVYSFGKSCHNVIGNLRVSVNYAYGFIGSYGASTIYLGSMNVILASFLQYCYINQLFKGIYWWFVCGFVSIIKGAFLNILLYPVCQWGLVGSNQSNIFSHSFMIGIYCDYMQGHLTLYWVVKKTFISTNHCFWISTFVLDLSLNIWCFLTFCRLQ